MTEIYPWQQVPNQGYNKYGSIDGRTVIGPGSSEAIERGINGFASSDAEVKLFEAPKDMKIPNLWDGGYNYPKRGSTVMIYGPLKEGDMVYTGQDWQQYAKKYNRKSLIDKNYSRFPSVMETTYVDAKTGEYLNGRLTNGSHNVIIGKKRANTGFAFFHEGQPILSSEAVADGKAAVKSKPFFAVAMDKQGCYLTPVKTVFKSVPTTPEAEAVYAKLQKAQNIVKKAEAYQKAGECTAEVVQNATRRAWKVFVEFASKIHV